MQDQLKRIADEIGKLKSLKEDVAEVKKIVVDCNEKLGPINQRLEWLEGKNSRVWQDMDVIQEGVWDIKMRIDQLEQYSRKTNMVVDGIPWEENEELKAIIEKLAIKLKIPFNKDEIAAIHRPPSKKRYPVNYRTFYLLRIQRGLD